MKMVELLSMCTNSPHVFTINIFAINFKIYMYLLASIFVASVFSDVFLLDDGKVRGDDSNVHFIHNIKSMQTLLQGPFIM